MDIMIITLKFESGQNVVKEMFPVSIDLIAFQETSDEISINGVSVPKNKFIETKDLVVNASRPTTVTVLAANVNLYPIKMEIHSPSGIKKFSINVYDGKMVWGQDSGEDIAIDKGYKILAPSVGELDTIYTAIHSMLSTIEPNIVNRGAIVACIVENGIVIRQHKDFTINVADDGNCIVIGK